MDFDYFRKIVDGISPMIKKASRFQLSTIEALYHKRVFDMMDYVSGCNKDIIFPLLTNGMLLNEQRIHEICRRNIPSVTISLDGYRKETVESFKTGVDFDRVVENIRLIKKIAGNKLQVDTIFVATEKNIGELEGYIDFCADLGVDVVFINGFMCFLPENSGLYLYSKDGNPEVFKLFERVFAKAEKRGLTVKFPSLTARPTGCELTQSVFIGERGDVSPCVLLARPTPMELFSQTNVPGPVVYGNVLEEDLMEIWNKKEFRQFREKSGSRNLPQECRLCADAYGVICSGRTMRP